MGLSVLSKTITKYAAKIDTKDPFFTLVLVGNGLANKAIEMNPDLLTNWPKYAAYLLTNSQACNPRYIADYLVLLSKRIREVIFHYI